MKRFSQLTQTATEADLVAGNFLAIDIPGVGGVTKKVPGNLVAPKSVQDNLCESFAKVFNPEKVGGYDADEIVEYNGSVYRFKQHHDGAWDVADVIKVSVFPYLLDGAVGVVTGKSQFVNFNDTSLWEEGGFNWNTGETSANANCLRTSGFYRITKRLIYQNLNGAVATVFAYDENENFVGWSASAGNTNAIENYIKNHPTASKFKILVDCHTAVSVADLATYTNFGSGDNNYVLTDSRFTALEKVASQNKQNIELLQRNGTDMFFNGAGTTYSFNRFTNFHEGNTYIVYLPEAWTVDDPTTTHYKLSIAAYADNTTLIKRFVNVMINQELSSSYKFTIPAGTKFISFGGRAEVGTTIRAAVVDITPLNEDDSGQERLVISAESLENQGVASGIPQHNAQTNRVLTNDVLVFPTPKFKFKYKAPDDVWFYFVTYNGKAEFGQYLFSSIGVYNGEENEVDVSSNAYYGYRVMFGRRGNEDITAAEVQDFIRNGDIEIILEYDAPNYSDGTQLTRGLAAKKKLIGSQPWFSENATFVHVSDLHGDSTRLKNALRIANEVGADAVINSGDSSMYNHQCGTKYVEELFRGSYIPVLFCIGNHESYPTGQSALFTDNMQGLVVPNGYLKASGTPADDCYWYKDFDAKKIRVIALNYYNNGVYSGSLGQAQLDWFVATLASTPAGYGVIVEMHSPEDKILAVTGSDKFYQKHRVVTFQEDGFYIGNRPIMQIIDGFIGKTSGTEAYTDNGTPVSVSYDFTSLASGVEFIAYVVGHRHEDWIGKYEKSAHLQISLGITCGSAICSSNYYYGFSNQSDLPRNQGRGAMQDAVNVYGIDRDAGVIKVARIGSDVTELMDLRDFMTISYK